MSFFNDVMEFVFGTRGLKVEIVVGYPVNIVCTTLLHLVKRKKDFTGTKTCSSAVFKQCNNDTCFFCV